MGKGGGTRAAGGLEHGHVDEADEEAGGAVRARVPVAPAEARHRREPQPLQRPKDAIPNGVSSERRESDKDIVLYQAAFKQRASESSDS